MDVVKPHNVMDNNPTQVVNGISTTDSFPVTTGTATAVTTETVTTTAPGAKTPSELLLKSLQEEREKRRIAEEELQRLQALSTPSEPEEVYSDEGKLLKKKLDQALEQIGSITEERELEKVYNQFPLLREKASDFVEYRKAEHPRAKLESVAKLYLAENGLLDTPRKGLEKPTGGTRAPLTSGMTAEDVKTLRETNFRKYSEMLEKGQITIG